MIRKAVALYQLAEDAGGAALQDQALRDFESVAKAGESKTGKPYYFTPSGRTLFLHLALAAWEAHVMNRDGLDLSKIQATISWEMHLENQRKMRQILDERDYWNRQSTSL